MQKFLKILALCAVTFMASVQAMAAIEKLKLTHLRQAAAVDANDPGASPDAKIKLLTVALRTVTAKLDADAGVTDTNYTAVIDALEQ